MSTTPTLPPLPAMYCGPETGHVNTWLAEDLRAWGEACATAHASALAQRVDELTTARDVAVELGATYAARADELRANAERYGKLRARLNSANFYPEQMDLPPGVALIFILPKGSAVSGNLDKTIDAIEEEVKHG